jgi:hypothetical protein
MESALEQPLLDSSLRKKSTSEVNELGYNLLQKNTTSNIYLFHYTNIPMPIKNVED